MSASKWSHFVICFRLYYVIRLRFVWYRLQARGIFFWILMFPFLLFFVVIVSLLFLMSLTWGMHFKMSLCFSVLLCLWFFSLLCKIIYLCRSFVTTELVSLWISKDNGCVGCHWVDRTVYSKEHTQERFPSNATTAVLVLEFESHRGEIVKLFAKNIEGVNCWFMPLGVCTPIRRKYQTTKFLQFRLNSYLRTAALDTIFLRYNIHSPYQVHIMGGILVKSTT